MAPNTDPAGEAVAAAARLVSVELRIGVVWSFPTPAS